MFTNITGAPILLLPEFVLPNALPGTAQWISPYPDGTPGFTQLTLITFAPVVNVNVSMHKVPPGGAANASNLVIPGILIAQNQVYEQYYDTMNIIPAGYSLFLFATLANAVVVGVHGYNWG